MCRLFSECAVCISAENPAVQAKRCGRQRVLYKWPCVVYLMKVLVIYTKRCGREWQMDMCRLHRLLHCGFRARLGTHFSAYFCSFPQALEMQHLVRTLCLWRALGNPRYRVFWVPREKMKAIRLRKAPRIRSCRFGNWKSRQLRDPLPSRIFQCFQTCPEFLSIRLRLSPGSTVHSKISTLT